ncbi:MAG: prolyl oligopeptidase family serine peptidase, partial [Cyclobacteriaceae bacterium]
GELKKAPSYQWINQKDEAWSLLYKGEKYAGKDTEVFAYFASPNTLKGEKEHSDLQKFPAMVLIHGGGGTAFRNWAIDWAKKGFAAIAMDLGGHQSQPKTGENNPWAYETTRLENGGPYQDDVHKFFKLDQDITEQWQFHSISNIIRAHSLLLTLPEVEAERTGMTGISWGGYLTIIAAGIDDRFKAAVPVYGCGFLQEGSAWDQQFDSLGANGTQNWVGLWDPSQYVSHAKMPMLFINGTNDFAYFVENWNKTASLAPNSRLSLIPEMKHSHLHGAAPGEIHRFISHHLEDGPELSELKEIKYTASQIDFAFHHPEAIMELFLVYTSEEGRSPERKWESITLNRTDKRTTVPDTARLFYLYWIDEEGNRLSSAVFKR